MPFSLADTIFWVAVACCVVAQAAIIHSVVISPSQSRAADAASPASSARRVGEVAWAVLPGLALGAVLFFTWRAMHAPATVAAFVREAMR